MSDWVREEAARQLDWALEQGEVTRDEADPTAVEDVTLLIERSLRAGLREAARQADEEASTASKLALTFGARTRNRSRLNAIADEYAALAVRLRALAGEEPQP